MEDQLPTGPLMRRPALNWASAKSEQRAPLASAGPSLPKIERSAAVPNGIYNALFQIAFVYAARTFL